MGITTIEWTDRSVNPIRARNKKTNATGHYCEKISPGCANCYSSRFQPRFHMPTFGGARKLPVLPIVGENTTVSINDEIKLFFDESRLQEVLKRKKPTKWFWCDMTDMFGAWVPDAWIDKCFAVMALTPHHTHQVLTKRPERMAEYLNEKYEVPEFRLLPGTPRPHFGARGDGRPPHGARPRQLALHESGPRSADQG